MEWIKLILSSIDRKKGDIIFSSDSWEDILSLMDKHPDRQVLINSKDGECHYRVCMNVADKDGYRRIDGYTDLLKTYSIFFRQFISAIMVNKGPAGLYFNPKSKNKNYTPNANRTFISYSK